MATDQPLALIAADADDLQTMSALLQDAIVKVGDIAFLKDERRFVFVANRYRWEAKGGLFAAGERVRTGLHIDDVQHVRARSVRMDAADAVLSILSVAWEGDEEGGTITFHLSGGGDIVVIVEAVNVTLKDISEPWRAARQPDHGAN